MSVELLTEIEHLRSILHNLVADSVDYAKILEVSQLLDELLVEYCKAIL